MNLPFTKHTLDNGLDVLLHEDHACPIVAVNLWYHVGSKNERPGHTGFAHLFEHLMFEGSQHHDKGYFEPLQGAGAALNGSTNADRTNYWEVVPNNALELALWMESDRMGFLLPALTQAKFSNQRDVVLNERRQNYENRPYGLASMAMLAALFPADHPYHWTTIGEVADLHAVTLDEVRDFFTAYYHPANASLALAGDINPAEALDLAQAYFGEVPAGPAVKPLTLPAMSLEADQRFILEDRVELPRLYISWLTPAMYADGDADLDLAADVLANGKTSRLYRRLVFEERIATDVSASQNSREIGGFTQIAATAAPGHSLSELQAAMDEEVARLAAEGPTPDEIERGRVQAETQFVFRLQTVGGFGGKSDQLNAYNTYIGDPDFFDRDLARYQTVTAESLQAATRRYLAHDRRVMLSVVPAGRSELGLPRVRPGGRVVSNPSVKVNRSQLPVPPGPPPVTFPIIHKSLLRNGLRVWTVAHRSTPVIAFMLLVRRGAADNPGGQEGLAAITLDMLDEGSEGRSAIEMGEALAGIGAHLESDIGSDAAVLSATVLSRFAAPALSILADIAVRPSLLEEDFHRVRQLRLHRLRQLRDMPGAVADRTFVRLLYGSHPYGHTPLGSEPTLASLSIDDVRAFHQKAIRPAETTLVAVGDCDHEAIAEIAGRVFSDWAGASAGVFAAATALPAPARLNVVPRPGAPQSELRIGHVAVARNTPDYHAIVAANMVLGGQFVSRINLNLREDKGFTYGARTSFDFRRLPGPFSLQASVHTAATGRAIEESLGEIAAIRGTRKVTPEELALGVAALTRGYARGFETPDQVARGVAQIALYDLSDDYFAEFVPRMERVTVDDVTRVMSEHVDPSRLTTLVVGDFDTTREELSRLDLGDATVLSAESF